jgi:hypothetical protein
VELGIYSFGELTRETGEGSASTIHERFAQILELARLADAGGLDIITLGEHHRPDFSMSAPEVVLGAIAAVTSRLRLASGVTVLSSQDPVRVFEQFATLDHVSNGRAEIFAGRGAFIESFPLFGYDLADYDALFDEKLRLLLQIRDEPMVTWSGRFRSALHEATISPRPLQDASSCTTAPPNRPGTTLPRCGWGSAGTCTSARPPKVRATSSTRTTPATSSRAERRSPPRGSRGTPMTAGSPTACRSAARSR